jgi:hypothetical protein
MLVIQFHAKHRSGKHNRHDAFDFNMIFFHFVLFSAVYGKAPQPQTAKEAAKVSETRNNH